MEGCGSQLGWVGSAGVIVASLPPSLPLSLSLSLSLYSSLVSRILVLGLALMSYLRCFPFLSYD